VRDWLDAALSRMPLSEDAEGYLLGRGLREERIADLGVAQWDPAFVPGKPPDPAFSKTFGYSGILLTGTVAFPLRSPQGDLIGVEFRAWRGEKRMRQYLLPEASWTPMFAGMSLPVMQRIWNGGDVWIVEGIFDLAAMEHLVPTTDAVLGTLRARVSRAHADFLSRFCRGTVHMVYDQDETGRNMTHGYTDPNTKKRVWGALDSLRRVEVRCRDVSYSGGKDPGEIWDAGGLPSLRQAFNWRSPS
jgi:hypothetical protein